jgi:hypothetical protein
MSPAEWAGFGAGVMAVLSGGLIGLRFLVKGWLSELRPNGGRSSMKDQRSLRLEERVDHLFLIMNKRQ